MPDKDTNEAQTYCDDHDWWIDRGGKCKYCEKDREFADDISRNADRVLKATHIDGMFDLGNAGAPAINAYVADVVNTLRSCVPQLPAESSERKDIPMATGLLDYFPRALAEVARVSKMGNDKHNPGEPLHHARGKSMDHADCIMRHLAERGGFDGGVRHSAALAWRALALLQEELEKDFGLPLPRAAKAC